MIIVAKNINKISLEHFHAWKKVEISPIEQWVPPPPPYSPYFKINFDTEIRDSLSAQAAICRDHTSLVAMTSQIKPKCKDHKLLLQRSENGVHLL
ncbi:hypothetical protein SLA2020_277960 [Shorea laevis]